MLVAAADTDTLCEYFVDMQIPVSPHFRVSTMRKAVVLATVAGASAFVPMPGTSHGLLNSMYSSVPIYLSIYIYIHIYN